MNQDNAYEITRAVSKTGALSLVSEQTLDWARQLSQADKIALYCQVRDESQRMESEWREEFIKSIEAPAAALPAAESAAVDLVAFITWAKDHSDRGNVFDSFEEILEQASPAQIRQARQLILETGQDDLLEILEEYADPEDEA